MASVNKIILIGNLTRDPEIKYAASGTPICSFGLAMNHKFGEKEEVCFLDITAFGKLGELASQYLSKGRQAYVEGRLQQQRWEGQDGQQHSKHAVIADRIQFLGSKNGAPAGGGAPVSALQPPGMEDDIPF
jgi:single-strand DNA-binding protein